MAENPPPIDFEGEEEGDGEPLISEEKESEELELPASLEPEEVERDEQRDEPPTLEPEPPQIQPQPAEPAVVAASAPPPTLEAREADEGDEAEAVAKPVAQHQPQRTLDLFEEDPPAPQHVSSQVGAPSLTSEHASRHVRKGSMWLVEHEPSCHWVPGVCNEVLNHSARCSGCVLPEDLKASLMSYSPLTASPSTALTMHRFYTSRSMRSVNIVTCV